MPKGSLDSLSRMGLVHSGDSVSRVRDSLCVLASPLVVVGEQETRLNCIVT